MKSRKYLMFIAIAVIILFSGLFLWGNNSIEINKIEVKSGEIPENFSGFRIVQISDLHNEEFGDDNNRLLDKIKKANPDIIAITGDLIDMQKTDAEIALEFIKEAMKIAQVYYVTGNHEANVESEYNRLKADMERAGVIILENASVKVEKGGEYITLAGVNDSSFLCDYNSSVANAIPNDGSYTVLLAHRPEYFDLYAEERADIVLSGHAHGGQFRIPFAGGVVAPGQGFFPKYDSGVYKKGATSMVVSRGLGNSIIPLRINNRPEIIVVELIKKFE